MGTWGGSGLGVCLDLGLPSLLCMETPPAAVRCQPAAACCRAGPSGCPFPPLFGARRCWAWGAGWGEEGALVPCSSSLPLGDAPVT